MSVGSMVGVRLLRFGLVEMEEVLVARVEKVLGAAGDQVFSQVKLCGAWLTTLKLLFDPLEVDVLRDLLGRAYVREPIMETSLIIEVLLILTLLLVCHVHCISR